MSSRVSECSSGIEADALASCAAAFDDCDTCFLLRSTHLGSGSLAQMLSPVDRPVKDPLLMVDVGRWIVGLPLDLADEENMLRGPVGTI